MASCRLNTSSQTLHHDHLVHERAMLCCRMARLLHVAMTGIDCSALRFADRSRLGRALAQLDLDIAQFRSDEKLVVDASPNTTKAATAASPSP